MAAQSQRFCHGFLTTKSKPLVGTLSRAAGINSALCVLRIPSTRTFSFRSAELHSRQSQGQKLQRALDPPTRRTFKSTATSHQEASLARDEVDFLETSESVDVDASPQSQVPTKSLQDYSLSKSTLANLERCGITSLFPVQEQTFEALMAGKDMVVKSRTGSGKTIAFVLPIVEKILSAPVKGRRNPRSVVLAPTRELAIQIHREFERIGPQVQSVCIYGGASYIPQETALRRGVDVVVGTPGRTIDHINKGTLDMRDVEVFVLDEADEMLKMGFQNDVETIVSEIPRESRQTNLWSATMPRWVQKLAKEYCKDLQYVDMVGEDVTRTAATIQHVAIACEYDARAAVIADVVRLHGKNGRALVFANTKADVDALAASPELKGTARTIHGDVNQSQREVTLQDFRSGAFTTLIATDVAARGIDVPEVEVVIQTSVPEDEDTFVHRSGRTGRAGRDGVNVVLYKENAEPELLRLQNDVGIEFALEGSPPLEAVLQSRMREMSTTLEHVPARSTEKFEGHAAELIERLGDKALPAALAMLAGFGSGVPSRFSVLQGRRDHVTLHARMEPRLRGKVRGLGQFRDMLERSAHGARISTGKILFLPAGILFDVPTAQVAELLGDGWEQKGEQEGAVSVSPMPGLTIEIADKLPPVDVMAQAVVSAQRRSQRPRDGGGGGRGGYGARRYEGGGRYGGSGRRDDRNGGRDRDSEWDRDRDGRGRNQRYGRF